MNTLHREAMRPQNIDSLSLEELYKLLQTFTNPEETAVLTHHFDEHETVFTGYTIFKGVDLKVDGEIVVALNHE